MSQVETFDPTSFKEGQRADWQTAAPGWRKWYDVLEGEAGGQVVSRKLVEVAGYRSGRYRPRCRHGLRRTALTAARAVGPGGRVVRQTSPPISSPSGGNVPSRLACKTSSSSSRTPKHSRSTRRASTRSFRARGCSPPRRHRDAETVPLLPQGDGRLAAAVWGPPDTVQFALPVGVIVKELELPHHRRRDGRGSSRSPTPTHSHSWSPTPDTGTWRPVR